MAGRCYSAPAVACQPSSVVGTSSWVAHPLHPRSSTDWQDLPILFRRSGDAGVGIEFGLLVPLLPVSVTMRRGLKYLRRLGWLTPFHSRQFPERGTLCPLGGLRNPLWAPHSWRLVDFGMPILALRLLPRFHLLSAWTHLRGGVCSAWASPWSPRCCGMAI